MCFGVAGCVFSGGSAGILAGVFWLALRKHPPKMATFANIGFALLYQLFCHLMIPSERAG